MGLRKAGLFEARPAGGAVAGGMLLFSLALQFGGGPVRDALMYDRSRIAAGEVYRLASGHFVHLDWRHLALNLAGLVLVWLLVGHRYRARQWLLIIAVTAASIDGGFWWLMPELHWYVGLSGILHGLLVAGAIGLYRERRSESLILLIAVAIKLAWEQFHGPLPGSADAIGGTVITEAHLLGAAGGAAAAAAILLLAARPAGDRSRA